MSPKNQSKSVTIVGGVNVAPDAPTLKSTTKADTNEPEEPKPAASVPPKEPTE